MGVPHKMLGYGKIASFEMDDDDRGTPPIDGKLHVDDLLIEIHPLRCPKDSKDAAERAVQRFDGAWVDNRQIKLEVEA